MSNGDQIHIKQAQPIEEMEYWQKPLEKVELGSGGQGKVYRVSFEENGKQYAMKESIFESRMISEEERERKTQQLRAEYMTARKCTHPSVVNVYGFFNSQTATSHKSILLMELAQMDIATYYSNENQKGRGIPERQLRIWLK